jgi:hypothetical protein
MGHVMAHDHSGFSRLLHHKPKCIRLRYLFRKNAILVMMISVRCGRVTATLTRPIAFDLQPSAVKSGTGFKYGDSTVSKITTSHSKPWKLWIVPARTDSTSCSVLSTR